MPGLSALSPLISRRMRSIGRSSNEQTVECRRQVESVLRMLLDEHGTEHAHGRPCEIGGGRLVHFGPYDQLLFERRQ